MKKMKTVKFNLRIPEELLLKIRQSADKHQCSINTLILMKLIPVVMEQSK